MIKKLKAAKRRPNRMGATTVEFAFIAPIFFLVIFGCIEFTRLSMLRNLAQNAAYEASRFSMMEGASEDHGKRKAELILGRLGAEGVTIETTYESIGGVDRALVNTRVTIPISQNTIALPAAVFGDKSIIAESQLRTERYSGFYDSGN